MSTHDMRNRTFLLGAKGIVLGADCCRCLVTELEREKRGFYPLRIEVAQLRGVPWVLLIHPCLGVA
jgi:hypothetical protein